MHKTNISFPNIKRNVNTSKWKFNVNIIGKVSLQNSLIFSIFSFKYITPFFKKSRYHVTFLCIPYINYLCICFLTSVNLGMRTKAHCIRLGERNKKLDKSLLKFRLLNKTSYNTVNLELPRIASGINELLTINKLYLLFC